MRHEIHIKHHKYYYTVPFKNFKFTGRIKYTKYANKTLIHFEITYTKSISTTIKKYWFSKPIISYGVEEITQFIIAEDFLFIELPEIEIVECECNK